MVADLAAHPVLYAALPVLGALAGYLAYRAGLATLCRGPAAVPGLRPLVRTHASGISEALATLVATELVDAQELLSRLDPAEMVHRIEAPLRAMVDETTVELMQRHKPDMWELLPLRVKHAVIRRARSRAPELARSVLAELETDAGEVLDVHALVARVLRDDTALRTRVVRDILAPVLRAGARRAAVLGLVLGLAEVPAVAAWQPALAAGPVVVALACAGLCLLPAVRPRGLRGALRSDVQRHRSGIGSALAGHLASRVLVFAQIIAELTGGPRNDRVRELVRREVVDTIDAQVSVAKPVVSVAIGSGHFQDIKNGAAASAMDGAATLTRHLSRYADESMDVRATVAYRLRRMPATRWAPVVRAVLRPALSRRLAWALLVGLAFGAAQFGASAAGIL